MKKSNILFLVLLPIAIVAAYFLLKNEVIESFSVCVSPGNCKTVVGAPVTAITENQIGYPADFHRERSVIHKDTKVDFDRGRFDEKTLYFAHENKVFWFVNAKILTGFSENAGLLPNSDAETFEIIDANYARDKNQVYGRPDVATPIANTIIIAADPETFITLDWPCAKDKDNYYKFAVRVEASECLE